METDILTKSEHTFTAVDRNYSDKKKFLINLHHYLQPVNKSLVNNGIIKKLLSVNVI